MNMEKKNTEQATFEPFLMCACTAPTLSWVLKNASAMLFSFKGVHPKPSPEANIFQTNSDLIYC